MGPFRAPKAFFSHHAVSCPSSCTKHSVSDTGESYDIEVCVSHDTLFSNQVPGTQHLVCKNSPPFGRTCKLLSVRSPRGPQEIRTALCIVVTKTHMTSFVLSVVSTFILSFTRPSSGCIHTKHQRSASTPNTGTHKVMSAFPLHPDSSLLVCQ